MPTVKQKRAVEAIAENGGNVSKAMREVGYTDITAATPKKLTESKGYKELLDKYLPDDLILGSLESDIKNKPKNRLGELALAAKIKGMDVNKLELEGRVDVYNALSDDQLDKIIKQKTRETTTTRVTRGKEKKNTTESSTTR